MDPAGVTLALELVLAIDTSARLVRLDITTATTPDRHRAGATFPLCLHYRALHHASLAVDPKRVDQAVRAYGCVGSLISLESLSASAGRLTNSRRLRAVGKPKRSYSDAAASDFRSITPRVARFPFAVRGRPSQWSSSRTARSTTMMSMLTKTIAIKPQSTPRPCSGRCASIRGSDGSCIG